MHFGRTIAAGTHDVQGDSHDVQGDSIAHAMQQYLYITHVMNADEIFSSDQIRPGIVYFASSEVRPESGMIIPDSCLLDVPVVVGMCACVRADRDKDGWFKNWEDKAQYTIKYAAILDASTRSSFHLLMSGLGIQLRGG